MDRAATSDLRIGVDQSREGEDGSPLGAGGVDIEAAVCFVLPACFALSSLIIFSA